MRNEQKNRKNEPKNPPINPKKFQKTKKSETVVTFRSYPPTIFSAEK